MLDAIQQFDIVYAMTQGGPGDTLMVFQIEAYLQAFTFTNIARASAILVVLWFITFVLSNIFVKNWLRLRERARGRA
jgi:multiple sugar transport system permease protein